MELREKKILVVGLGKTGIQTVKFLLKKGADVRASDLTPLENLPKDIKQFKETGVEIEAGGHKTETFLSADTIILSPGVPFGIAPIKEAVSKGIEVISEIELAWRFIKKPIAAITGSNGKTTTSTLIARILEAAGKTVFLGANIGTPLIQIAEEDDPYDFLVLELSSFQLQGISSFKPHIGVLLNISPNHLDHHESFDEYVESKMKMFSNQTHNDWAIYNSDDKVIRERSSEIRSKRIPFGKTPLEGGVFYDGTHVRFKDEVYDLRSMRLVGIHNIENAMAAIAVTRTLGCKSSLIEDEIVNFAPLPHRIEFVRKVKGAAIYNDSKSTSPGATLRAIESFPGPIILIAGGKDKGVSYSALRDGIRKRVKLLVLFGESKQRMREDLGGETETVLAQTLDEAVKEALINSERGDTVLFSPACSSFDMFSSYEERGRIFKGIVQSLSD
jgi:UDP-N-acetylmuramoylalanine--D-glutamate ligase